MSRERPILMSGPLVRAVLDGRKSQTRRPISPVQPRADGRWPAGRDPLPDCPFGQVSDRLWVREAWGLRRPFDRTDWHRGSLRGATEAIIHDEWAVDYRAAWGPNQEGCFWRPSVHMPRWASRLTLRITDVRVERLQDISEEDARAEGVDPHPLRMDMDTGLPMERETARSAFARAWGGIYGTESWDANPFVWTISFEREVAS